MDIDSFKVGMSSSCNKVITKEDVSSFAALTGDNNPIHLCEEFAKTTIFEQPVVHGMLVTSLFSKIFGTQFPGNGCIYLEQSVRFVKPIFLNQDVTAIVTINAIDKNKSFLYFDTVCTVEDKTVITGFATIHISKVR
ncbi:MAG: 3-hydroxybutyryl-CoA dehydratase [Cognaticolwellia sp.]|jgi:3-hydroxybutyryl-CoA dehydratase